MWFYFEVGLEKANFNLKIFAKSLTMDDRKVSRSNVHDVDLDEALENYKILRCLDSQQSLPARKPFSSYAKTNECYHKYATLHKSYQEGSCLTGPSITYSPLSEVSVPSLSYGTPSSTASVQQSSVSDVSMGSAHSSVRTPVSCSPSVTLSLLPLSGSSRLATSTWAFTTLITGLLEQPNFWDLWASHVRNLQWHRLKSPLLFWDESNPLCQKLLRELETGKDSKEDRIMIVKMAYLLGAGNPSVNYRSARYVAAKRLETSEYQHDLRSS